MQGSQDKLRKFVILLITWLLLFAFFFAYDTYFVNGQKEFLLERELRTVAGLAQGVEAEFSRARISVESGVKLLASVPAGRIPALSCAGNSKDSEKCGRNYIDFYLSGALIPVEGAVAPKCWQAPDTVGEVPFETTLDTDQLRLTVRCLTKDNASKPGTPANISKKPILVLDLSPWILGALEHVTDSFEHVVIADKAGHALFEKGASGLEIRDLTEMVASSIEIGVKQPSPGLFAKGSQESNIPGIGVNSGRKVSALFERSAASRVLLGGQDYLLFSHPIRPTLGNYSSAEARVPLLVCGLRRAADLEAESRSLPYGFLIWVSLAAMVLLSISWPLFKLRYMGNTERFTPRDGWYLVLALFLMSTGAATMLLNASYIAQARDHVDQEMKSLAKHIVANYTGEIESAYKQLREFRHDESVLRASMKAEAPILSGSYLADSVRTSRKLVYPYFQIGFWADCHGRQLLKFDVRPAPTPPTDISRFEFFKNAMTQILRRNPGAVATRDDPCPEVSRDLDPDGGSFTHLYLQPLVSPNTDEFAPVLSAPFKNGSENTKRISIQALVLRPMSVVDPVLPPGYRFAVIDRQCLILFHSDSFRDLRENFCEESKGRTELQPWLFGSVDSPLDISYAGRTERAYVAKFPLPTLSATGAAFLIVFQDRDRGLTLNLAVVLVCSILLAVYVGILTAAAILHLLVRRPLSLTYAPRFLWPQAKESTAYVQLFCINVVSVGFYLTVSRYLYEAPLLALTVEVALLSVLFGMARLACSPHSLYAWGMRIAQLAAVGLLYITFSYSLSRWLSRPVPFGVSPEWAVLFVMPLFVALFGALVSGRARPIVHFRASWIARLSEGARKHFTATYALTAVSLIICAAVVPCLGFFKYAYDAVNEISLKHDQALLADRLIARRNRIYNYYDSVNAPGFAACRAHESLDRYDKLFFTVNSETALASSPQENCVALLPDPVHEQVASAGEACASRSGQSSDWLNDQIEKAVAKTTLTFPANEMGMEMTRLGVASTNSGDAWERYWNEIEPRCFQLSGKPGSRLENFTLKSVYPRWQGLRSGAWGYLTLFMAGLVFWLVSLTRQIFLTGVHGAPPFEVVHWKAISDIKTNSLVIGRTQSGKTKFLRELPGFDLRDWRDLRSELEKKIKDPNYQAPVCHGGVLILDSFEFNICDPAWNRARLELLETLLYEVRSTVVVISTIDPSYFLSEEGSKVLSVSKDPDESSRLFDRWVRALSKFVRVTLAPAPRDEFLTEVAKMADRGSNRAQFATWVWRECGSTSLLRKIGITILHEFASDLPATRGQLAEIVLDRANTYYHVLWSGLTASERLVLYQLALDGWANPKNAPAIQQLERKQLICKAPMYRIMNDSFCKFVEGGEHATEILEWGKREQENTWHAFRFVLIAVLIGGGVWLLYTQAQLFQIGTGTITALATFLTAIAGFSARFKRSAGSDAKVSAAQGASE